MERKKYTAVIIAVMDTLNNPAPQKGFVIFVAYQFLF
jgi:hypothetical protein